MSGARHRRQRPEAAIHAAVCDHLRDGGRLSDAQLEFLARFNDAGGHSASAEGIDLAIACLEGWGLLVGRRR
jgi:hypothetical protein